MKHKIQITANPPNKSTTTKPTKAAPSKAAAVFDLQAKRELQQQAAGAPPRVKRWIRPKAVCEKIGGISRVQLWRIVRDDPTMPKPKRVTERIVVFDDDLLDAWLAAQPEQLPTYGPRRRELESEAA